MQPRWARTVAMMWHVLCTKGVVGALLNINLVGSVPNKVVVCNELTHV